MPGCEPTWAISCPLVVLHEHCFMLCLCSACCYRCCHFQHCVQQLPCAFVQSVWQKKRFVTRDRWPCTWRITTEEINPKGHAQHLKGQLCRDPYSNMHARLMARPKWHSYSKNSVRPDKLLRWCKEVPYLGEEKDFTRFRGCAAKLSVFFLYVVDSWNAWDVMRRCAVCFILFVFIHRLFVVEQCEWTKCRFQNKTDRALFLLLVCFHARGIAIFVFFQPDDNTCAAALTVHAFPFECSQCRLLLTLSSVKAWFVGEQELWKHFPIIYSFIRRRVSVCWFYRKVVQ